SLRAAGEETAGESDGVHDRAGKTRAREALRLAVEEREVEAGVVRDEHGVARELEESPHGDRRMRMAAQICVAQAGQRADRRPDRDAGVDEQLEFLLQLELADAHRADLADPRTAGAQAGRLEVDHDEGRAVERDVGAWR